MMENQRADARFRIHHESFRQLNANFFRLQQLPESYLIFEIRTGRVAKAVALPAIA